ncbi:MAG: C10 family peptidase [Planctomycetota bacterium]|jgi:hypothetical protein
MPFILSELLQNPTAAVSPRIKDATKIIKPLSEKMKLKSIVAAAILVLLHLHSSLLALPTTEYEAQMIVTGWLKTNPQPLGMSLGRQVTRSETFTNDYGEPVYYIVYLQPSGFVIVSADDLVEPIIGFVNDSTYEASLDDPLGALVTRDLNERIGAVRNNINLLDVTGNAKITRTQKKWRFFISLAKTSENELVLMGLPPICDFNNPSDVRIAPFVQTKWGQKNIPCDGWNSRLAVFNYYTPQLIGSGDSLELSWDKREKYYGDPNNFYSGCIATAMAQLMCYYQYPDKPNEPDDPCTVEVGKYDGEYVSLVDPPSRTLLGGDEHGGPYNWNLMLELNCDANNATRQAIGAICHDAGVSVNTFYTADLSSAYVLHAKGALVKTFKYGNAVNGRKWGSDIGPGLIGMINPNLDAKKPVILGIWGPDDGGHAAVCDGYGYDDSTLYYHLNMGWQGRDDCWYNLPHIVCPKQGYEFSLVNDCIYNIFPSGKGEIISGRVLQNNGEPAENAVVYRLPSDGADPCAVSTDSNGIYFFDKLDPNTTYTIWASIDINDFPHQQVRTGNSKDYGSTAGNVWGVYFQNKPPELYVDDNAVSDTLKNNPYVSDPYEDGSTEHPFDTIQEAIDAAMPGDTVIIREGTYTGDGNRDLDFKCKPIIIQSEYPDDPNVVAKTIINCEGNRDNPHRGFIFQSGEKAVSVVKGLTITNGYHDTGGGIYCINDSSPTITNCTFVENDVNEYGGGIYNKDSVPNVRNCTFHWNSAAICGGGVFNSKGRVELTDCTFSLNSAKYGGGIFNEDISIINNCTFIENDVNEYGGGIFNSKGQAELTDCTFSLNLANRGGGLFSQDGDAAVKNCMFSENDVNMYGGGMYNNNSRTTITNCIFKKNNANELGGGILNIKGQATITNCTFSLNSAKSGSGLFNQESSPTITNCIIWDNTPNQITGAAASYSNVEDIILLPGDTNINSDPRFEDDYHLKSDSPCIDSGDNSAVPSFVQTDLDGNPRLVDGNGDGVVRVDMGAYEFQPGTNAHFKHKSNN